MANSFVVTSLATEPLKLDQNGKATIVFTVTNTTSKPLRGLAKVKALGSTKQEWLSIAGETERDFPPGGTQQFTVNFNPAGATAAAAPLSAGKYEFRLNVASSINSDEDFTESSPVTIEVPEQKTPPPPPPFPWWIILAIVGVLLIGGLILFFVLRPNSPNTNENLPTPTPVTSPTPIPVTPTPAPPASPFAGNWRNQNSNTNGITRIIISQENTVLKVHPFGKCSPTDCDWGERAGGIVGGIGQIVFDQGFAVKNMQIVPQPDGKLKVIVDTVFNDSRPRQHSEDIFVSQFRPTVNETLGNRSILHQ